jgi:NitT/TauT family transport system ATP-binding protein
MTSLSHASAGASTVPEAPILGLHGSMSKKIVARSVRIVYRGKHNHEPILACNGIDLDVDESAFVSIVGPSGCGKTTLLYAIDGLLPINGGEIRVNDKPVTGPDKDRALVFQSASLLPWRSVWGNITYGLKLRNGMDQERTAKVETLIELVGLRGFEKRYPAELSGGMQQRANLARALAVDPDILLLDEPFASVDAQTREKLQVELTEIWRRTQKTMLFVTHDIAEAVFLSDRVVVFSARPAEVRQIIDIDIPRPRSLETKRSAVLQEYVKRVWNLIDISS